MDDAAKPSAEQTNVKETIESILVAFILAFMFRAFVVEAFVIPTGSMAPTLLGAHLRYRCEDCGYEYDVNYQNPESMSEDVSIPDTARLPQADRSGSTDKTYRIHCPNCGFRVPRQNPGDPENVATNPAVYYGDRILVLKYLYLLQDPRRWDVVVFKSPYQPEVHDYTQNYIKRLVGKPGESVLVLDGDIYVSTKAQNSLPEDFVVQTKPRWAQEALWRVVFDNDFQPRGASRTLFNAAGRPVGTDPSFVNPWKPVEGESGWDTSGRRTLRFDKAAGAATLRFDPDANPYTWSLTDWLAYDITMTQNGRDYGDTYLPDTYYPDNNVSDVKLSFYYQKNSGSGPLRLRLEARPGTAVARTFVAEIHGSDARLLMTNAAGEETVIGTARLDVDFGTPTRVELIHADYQTTLRVANRDILSTTPAQYSPDVRFLINAYRARERLPKPRIAITAENQSAEFRHLGLWRDVYYTNRRESGATGPGLARGGPALDWASPEDFPNRVIHLGEDEYFVCGDNSMISGDGRFWTQPINLPAEDLFVDPGRVPGRFLLGKAFFVYWPAGYKPAANTRLPAIVPNFGRMRFIH